MIYILLTVITIVAFIVISLRVYLKLTLAICKTSAHMVGKVVIVTGSNCGIGFETAKDLASRGARVILACRSAQRGTEAREEIVKASGNTDVHYKQLDLASLRSVRDFCDDIIKNEKRLDVLINNAGAGGLGNHKTSDGIHIGMQVNYYGPFLLTCLLLPLLKKSTPSRILNVSSVLHKRGKIDFDNLNMEKDGSDSSVYSDSKLFLNLMTLELSKRLVGSGVTVNCLHPGYIATNLIRNIPNKILKGLVKMINEFLLLDAWEGSQTTIYLAVSKDVQDVSGKYFSDCRETKPSKLSQDSEKAKRLWFESERLVKYSLP